MEAAIAVLIIIGVLAISAVLWTKLFDMGIKPPFWP